MTRAHILAMAVLASACGFAVAHASDSTALYARIDRVVLAPAGAPDTIQVWGVFSMAKPNDPNAYLPPARGYLYFTLADQPSTARKEWADLQQVAGTGQLVSFGSRYQLHATLRKPDDRVDHPDPYVVSMGVSKVRGNTDYAPIRAILDFKN